MNAISLNFPLILTLVRLIVSPLLIPVLCVEIVPQQSFLDHFGFALFFVLLSLTDFLDGYLARRYGQTTPLGTLLDPLADKFLLFSTLIPLVYIHRIFYYWALIFIGRELFVMGLREIALSKGFQLAVNSSAKLKTVFQVVYLTYVISNPYPVNSPVILFAVEYVLLSLALGFSLYSAFEYYRLFRIRISDDLS